ncbi:M42 family metallopeptidase [Anaeromicrobium sediminis]|uniref:Aminopeptidase n=1 Tax=Anaeromicrobium sediminis TaxID=1478221 RepID=A0A267MKT7_9FIRM|nr:M42 family metallopeptidase [Anaeromicrobium sediminis]PAB60201.1 aminopeptidase [Anaeromicrobium sediminis]
MELADKLKKLVETDGVSGFEENIFAQAKDLFFDLCDDIQSDPLGNMIAHISRGGHKKVMLAAHMDEIGLMVKDIDDAGFVQFTNIGGYDYRTLPAQEVIVHGREKVFGIVATKPPHIQNEEDKKKAPKMEDMRIDIGLSKEEAKKVVSIGDPITVKRHMLKLQNDFYSSKAMDDRAGVLAMLHCFEILKKMNHSIDVYGVCTVQEEVGTRGAIVSAFNINPDIGIAVDVGFGSTPELPKDETLDLSKGVGIAFGANIHPKLHKKLIELAKEHNIPYQVDLVPGNSGTDTRSIQISRCGIATALLSIPLRYMHTSVETLSMEDIKNVGKLLAYFILSLDNIDLEELLCF